MSRDAASPTRTTRAQEETILRRRIEATIGALPGVFVHRNEVGVAVMPSGARVSYGVGGVGAPDLLVEVIHESSGHAICTWLEIKTPTGAVEPHQRQWHDAARRTGRNVAVVRSEDEAAAAVAEVRVYGRLQGDVNDGGMVPP